MYVVAGVSGNTGKVVAETLLSRGKKVRVIVRDAAKGESWRARGAEVAVLSLSDGTALAKALVGAAGAYLLVPPNPSSSQVLADNGRVADAIVSAVTSSGVGHFAFLSSVGAHLASGTGPIQSVHRVEEKIRASKTDATFIRAASFMENWGGALGGIAGGVFPTFLHADRPHPTVATKDIAATAVKALIEAPKGQHVIELSGPRDYTPREIAGILSSILGKPLELQEAPESAIIPTFTSFGASPDMAELYREMLHGINAGVIKFEGGAARAQRGPTPIEEVLKTLLANA